MPKLGKENVYNAIYKAALEHFKNNSKAWAGLIEELPKNTPFYRYVNYRSLEPQQDEDSRKIWRNLEADVDNRWTGSGPERTGKQGLYLSMEEPGPADTAFPELDYYQDPQAPVAQSVASFKYQKGQAPEWISSKASELRSMFLFTSTKSLKRLDLRLTEKTRLLLQAILNKAKELSPELKDQALDELYMNDTDASFDRAMGNAVLTAFNDVDVFLTTSVRDRKCTNAILRGEAGKASDALKAQGRITFLLSQDKSKGAVYTIDDLLYNDQISGTVTPKSGTLTPKDALAKELRNFKGEAQKIKGAARQIAKNIDWELLKRQLDTYISSSVKATLSKTTDPFTTSVEELAANFAKANRSQFQRDVTKQITQHVNESAQTCEGYKKLYDKIGLDGVASLLLESVVKPRIEKLMKSFETSGPSYLQLSAQMVLAEENSHRLQQQLQKWQEDLTIMDDQVGPTTRELAERQQELAKVKRQSQDKPSDRELKERRKSLEAEVSRLVKKEKAQNSARQDLRKDRAKAEQKRRDLDAMKRRTEKAREKRGREIFRK